MPKNVLLNYNVRDFLNTGQINFCISDIVYREKRQVVMFQDVLDTQNYGRDAFRQLVISTPIFDDFGKIRNILAVTRPLDKLNQLYYQANQADFISSFTGRGTPPPVKGSAVIAESPIMQEVLSAAATVAAVDSAVLITGESGTGKEVVAQYIHDASPRADKPLVVINCASLPETLLEAELFGYEKGAFTGAAAGGKVGLFEAADGGTLFLDEINSLPLNLQGKVLRALETKTIQRVGSTRSKKVDFRLLTATNEDLIKLIDEKRFRTDLYYRLAVIPIHLPPPAGTSGGHNPPGPTLSGAVLPEICENKGIQPSDAPTDFPIFLAWERAGTAKLCGALRGNEHGISDCNSGCFLFPGTRQHREFNAWKYRHQHPLFSCHCSPL